MLQWQSHKSNECCNTNTLTQVFDTKGLKQLHRSKVYGRRVIRHTLVLYYNKTHHPVLIRLRQSDCMTSHWLDYTIDTCAETLEVTFQAQVTDRRLTLVQSPDAYPMAFLWASHKNPIGSYGRPIVQTWNLSKLCSLDNRPCPMHLPIVHPAQSLLVQLRKTLV